MKKRLWLILLVLLPSALGIECVSYRDCAQISCPGATRLCVEGACVYSACVTAGERLTGPSAGMMDSIVSWSVRLFFFLIIAVILALVLPLTNFRSKAKIIAAACIIGILIALSLYFLGGESAIRALIGREEPWDSATADRHVMAAGNADNLEIAERVLTRGVKEYKLRDDDNEASVLAFMLEPGTRVEGLSLNVRETMPKTIQGYTMQLQQNRLYDVYVWEMEGTAFVLAGEGDYARHLAQLLVGANTTDVRPIKNVSEGNSDALGDRPPVITLIEPGEMAYSTTVRFTVADNDSLINASSIAATGVRGFGPYDCMLVDSIYNCSFSASLSPGMNTILITAADVEGKASAVQRSFMFDNQSWRIEGFYPTNNSLVNIRTVRFRLIDPETDIDSESFTFNGLNLSLSGCTHIDHGLDCVFQNLNISDGTTIMIISGADNAGNFRRLQYGFTIDTVRPAITIMSRGWQVFDAGGLGNESIMVDHTRYPSENCNLIDGVYHCPYGRAFSTVSVTDLAGNTGVAENKLSR
jgi:hypothetical protein